MKSYTKLMLLIFVVIFSVISTSGCTDTETNSYTFIGSIENFDANDGSTFLHKLTDLTLYLDNNQTIFTTLSYWDASKVRIGQEVYEDSDGIPWILIDGNYY